MTGPRRCPDTEPGTVPGQDASPDRACDPDWAAARDVDVLPDISDYQETGARNSLAGRAPDNPLSDHPPKGPQ